MTTLDAGDGVTVEVVELAGPADGPTVAILGGVHGDELEGILAVRTLIRTLELKAGRVRAVPVANPPAHVARSRTNPLDDGNLARSFPGSPQATPTGRIADVLTRHVIHGSDLLIDLHSAGAHYAMPLFAGFCDPAGEAAAFAFGAPLVWAHEGINPGRSLAVAHEAGIPAIYVEGSGGGALLQSEVDAYVDGVRRVLAQLGLLAPVDEPAPAPGVLRGGDGDVDSSVAASVTGWCVTTVRAGDVVQAGQPVASIVDEAGAVAERIVAPHDGTVMMLRRTAPVEPGVGIVMLGPVPS